MGNKVKVKATVNIYSCLNGKDYNYSKVLSDALRKELRKHKEAGSDGSLCKKTLVVDEDILQEAKQYNINLSQVLDKALFDLEDAADTVDKYKKGRD